MSIFDLANCSLRPSHLFGGRRCSPFNLPGGPYQGLVKIAIPAPKRGPKPQLKTWRAVVDVFGYGEQDISVTKEGKNIIVQGCHERPHSVEGDYDRREMRHTVAVPEAVPMDDCSMNTLVIGGRLLIELKEKLPEFVAAEAAAGEGDKAPATGMDEAAAGETSRSLNNPPMTDIEGTLPISTVSICPKRKAEQSLVNEESVAVSVKKKKDLQVPPKSAWELVGGVYGMGCNLAGFTPDSVAVNVDERSKTVTVKAEERDDHSMRSFQKTVSLPKDAKAESLKSVFSDDGQLRITAEKVEMEERTTSFNPDLDSVSV